MDKLGQLITQEEATEIALKLVALRRHTDKDLQEVGQNALK